MLAAFTVVVELATGTSITFVVMAASMGTVVMSTATPMGWYLC